MMSGLFRRPMTALKGDERGSITILFALMLILFVLFAGGAVDFTRYNAVRADLTESLDAAGLAIAQLDAANGPELSSLTPSEREAYLKQYGEDFFYENFRHEHVVDQLSIDFDIGQTTIIPIASGRIKTVMLHAAAPLFGGAADNLKFLSLATDTEITRRGTGKIEVALVLDVTGSMGDAPAAGGDDKIVSLRNSVDNLLDVMFGSRTSDSNLKIGVVPYNAYVNPAGSEDWLDSWTDTGALAPYHGSRFFHVTGAGAVDLTRKVNHLDLFDSVTGGAWMGCVEARPYPLDELDTEPGVSVSTALLTSAISPLAAADEPNARMRDAFARAPAMSLSSAVVASANASRWVPMFRADEPDCSSNAASCRGDFTATESYVDGGVTTSVSFQGFWFDDPGEDSQTRGDYSNRSFIGDSLYTTRNQGEPTPRYAKIVSEFRSTLQTASHNPTFLSYLNGLGATSFGNDEYILRNSYVGWWDQTTETYKHRYNLSPSIDESISDTDSTMRGPNEDCPAAVLPLTSDRGDVEDKIAELFPNGNTNTANGAVWGWRLISPTAPFTEGADYDDSDWQKAVVIMTDGVNTVGVDDTHWESQPSAYGFAIEKRMGVGVNHGNRGNAGTFDADDMRDHVDEKLLRVCRRMKQQGILVYTIMFDVNDAATEAIYKACATSPEEPYFFVAPTGAQLEEAFGDIAQDLVDLHVSR